MTQKEYTGPEFEIEFARAWLKYVEAGKVGVDPRTQWEIECAGEWTIAPHNTPQCNGGIYRWKPIPKRTLTIGYESHDGAEWISKTLVAPEVEAPAEGTRVWIIGHGVTDYFWSPSKINPDCLKQGRIFLAQEDAQAMTNWLATCRKGGQS